jgi:hypothetical protein
MHPERHDLRREEPLDHAEQREQLLSPLQSHDEIGPERLDLVVLERLPGPDTSPDESTTTKSAPSCLACSCRAATAHHGQQVTCADST